MNFLMDKFINTFDDPSTLDVVDEENLQCVRFRQRLSGTATLADIIFYFSANNCVKIQVINVVRFEETTLELFEALNRYGLKYKCFKFLIDEDKDLKLEYDMLDYPEENLEDLIGYGSMAFNILEEIYPEIMKIRWS